MTKRLASSLMSTRGTHCAVTTEEESVSLSPKNCSKTCCSSSCSGLWLVLPAGMAEVVHGSSSWLGFAPGTLRPAPVSPIWSAVRISSPARPARASFMMDSHQELPGSGDMTIAVGDKIPSNLEHLRDGVQALDTHELFDGRKVVLFAGARCVHARRVRRSTCPATSRRWRSSKKRGVDVACLASTMPS
jgi:hypothetical protein